APLPILRLGLADDEPIGVEALARLGEELYDDDPTGRLHDGQTLSVVEVDGNRVLRLALPGVDGGGELDLGRRGDDLYLGVGPYRRVVTLPDTLRTRPVVGAGFDDGVLSVRFGPREEGDVG
ncbi:MAG: ArsA family ATPase, partial [Actinomycetota bacterium]